MNNTKFKLLNLNFLQNACHFLIISKHKLHAHYTYPALFITVEPNSTFLITTMYSDNYYRLRVAHVFTRSGCQTLYCFFRRFILLLKLYEWKRKCISRKYILTLTVLVQLNLASDTQPVSIFLNLEVKRTDRNNKRIVTNTPE